MAAHLIYLKSCLWTIRAIRAKHSLANALLLLCPSVVKLALGSVQLCVYSFVFGELFVDKYAVWRVPPAEPATLSVV